MATQQRISGERVGPAGKAEEGGVDSGGWNHQVAVVSATGGELGVGAACAEGEGKAGLAGMRLKEKQSPREVFQYLVRESRERGLWD